MTRSNRAGTPRLPELDNLEDEILHRCIFLQRSSRSNSQVSTSDALTLGVTLRQLGLEVALKLGTGRHELLQAVFEKSLTNFVETLGHEAQPGHLVVGDEPEDDEQDFFWQVHLVDLAFVRRRRPPSTSCAEDAAVNKIKVSQFIQLVLK